MLRLLYFEEVMVLYNGLVISLLITTGAAWRLLSLSKGIAKLKKVWSLLILT